MDSTSIITQVSNPRDEDQQYNNTVPTSEKGKLWGPGKGTKLKYFHKLLARSDPHEIIKTNTKYDMLSLSSTPFCKTWRLICIGLGFQKSTPQARNKRFSKGRKRFGTVLNPVFDFQESFL